MLKIIRNCLKAKMIKKANEVAEGYEYAKDLIARYGSKDPDLLETLFCKAYSEIFVDSYKQGIRKALCEYYQEQLKNEK